MNLRKSSANSSSESAIAGVSSPPPSTRSCKRSSARWATLAVRLKSDRRGRTLQPVRGDEQLLDVRPAAARLQPQQGVGHLVERVLSLVDEHRQILRRGVPVVFESGQRSAALRGFRFP